MLPDFTQSWSYEGYETIDGVTTKKYHLDITDAYQGDDETYASSNMKDT